MIQSKYRDCKANFKSRLVEGHQPALISTSCRGGGGFCMHSNQSSSTKEVLATKQWLSNFIHCSESLSSPFAYVFSHYTAIAPHCSSKSSVHEMDSYLIVSQCITHWILAHHILERIYWCISFHFIIVCFPIYHLSIDPITHYLSIICLYIFIYHLLSTCLLSVSSVCICMMCICVPL